MRIKPRLMRGKVQILLQTYADTVIKTVMSEHSISEYNLRKSNRPKHVAARRDLICRLHADGFGITEICRLVNMAEKTVTCHLNPKERAARAARHARIRARKQVELRA